MKQLVALLVIIFCVQFSYAQIVEDPSTTGGKPTIPLTRIITGRKDTLGFQHRDDRKDSIAVSYKFLDSVRSIPIDSSINDFDLPRRAISAAAVAACPDMPACIARICVAAPTAICRLPLIWL